MFNPKLLLRPKNVTKGMRCYFCPPNNLINNNLDITYGTEVRIVKKISSAGRGKSIVQVRTIPGGEEFNTLIINLATHKE